MELSREETLKQILRQIDDDHAHLHGLAAQIPDQGDGDPAAIAQVLLELVDYADVHFRREEYLMERLRYSGLVAHRREHSAMLNRLSALILDFERGNRGVAADIKALIADWSSRHIPVIDRRLIAFLERTYEEIA